MNSLPDIEEVKDKSVNKGCGAVRVYRMLPAVAKKKMKRSKSRDSRKRKVSVCLRVCSVGSSPDRALNTCVCVQIKTEDAEDYEMHSEMTQENTIDSTVNLSTASQEFKHVFLEQSAFVAIGQNMHFSLIPKMWY